MSLAFERAAEALASLSRELHRRNWVPATSGNFSARLGDGSIAISRSGRDKALLEPADIMRVDLNGRPLDVRTPSAETALHLQLYRRDPEVGAVLHTHSLNAVVASLENPDGLTLSGLELLKAFPGVDSHEARLTVPVFENSQDIAALSERVEQHMQRHGQGHAYLIGGHGVYTWGASLADCLRHLEALEYLFQLHRMRGPTV